MPAPVTHIAHATRWLITRPDVDAGAFIRGTIFPDIRYFGIIDRRATHQRGYVAADITGEALAWEAGRRYHCLMDDAWNEYFHRFPYPPGDDERYPFSAALKVAEAVLLLADLPDRDATARLLTTVDPQPLAAPWNLDVADVKRWQSFVAQELTAPIDPEHQLKFLDRLEFEPALARRIRRYTQAILDDAEWRRRIIAFGTAA